MDMEKMEPILMEVIAAMIGLATVLGVAQAYTPVPPPPSGFKCPYCPLYFDTLSELEAHIKAEHPDMPPFEEVDIDWGGTP